MKLGEAAEEKPSLSVCLSACSLLAPACRRRWVQANCPALLSSPLAGGQGGQEDGGQRRAEWDENMGAVVVDATFSATRVPRPLEGCGGTHDRPNKEPMG